MYFKSCFMIAQIFKDKHKVAGDINSLNLLVANSSIEIVDIGKRLYSLQ